MREVNVLYIVYIFVMCTRLILLIASGEHSSYNGSYFVELYLLRNQ